MLFALAAQQGSVLKMCCHSFFWLKFAVVNLIEPAVSDEDRPLREEEEAADSDRP